MARRYPPEVKAEAVRLRAEGYTLLSISLALGVSTQTANRWVNPEAEEFQKRYKERNRDQILEYKRNHSRARIHAIGIDRVPKELAKEAEKILFELQQPALLEKREKQKNTLMERKQAESAAKKAAKLQFPITYSSRDAWRQAQVYARDPDYRITSLLRKRVRARLLGQYKHSPATDTLLGLPAVELIEKWNVLHGPDWQTAEFHIDHIRPCSSFNMLEAEQQLVCFNWRNLQLLPARINVKKGGGWTPEMEQDWVAHMRSLGFVGDLCELFI
jgi:transposase-like protein